MITYHKHHIIPRHEGGTDDPSNLKLVTVEEHANIHKKLWESKGRWQDFIAWKALFGQITSEEARRLSVSMALKGKKQSAEHLKKRSNKGKKIKLASAERKQKIREIMKGRSPSEATRKAVSENNSNRKVSEETRKKMSEARKAWHKNRKLNLTTLT